MQIHQFLGQGQTDTGALVLAGGRAIHLRKPIEDPVQMLGGNPDAGILHRQTHAPVLALLAEHRNPPARSGELQRVSHQVDDHLLERFGIHVNHRQRLELTHLEPDALPLGQWPRPRHDLLDDRSHLDGSSLHRQLLPLDLRQIQEVVDQLEQPQPIRVDRLQIAPLKLRQLTKLPTQHRLYRRQRQRQRRPKLVMDVRSKPRLRDIQFLQLIPRPLNLGALDVIGKTHPIQEHAGQHALYACG